ncbi:unnamed protein product [Nippostrongylus brasiliensis]|uniref:Probable splicing factor, arginine/serine-rich 3 (inferred by orthology to a C. elegans protein) n=1 Tax=Nippostrongylus brasiliensis TaxID=27835 RepID=A0A0N4YYC0_NIPBR|nr:unnamed protein product [Nippostrongylus brasiliensis]
MGREDTRIYVGNLPSDVREKDIEDIFAKYGKIRFVDIKGGRGPLYAFVEFEDYRDAEDAVRGRDGYDFDGCRIRVEFTRGLRSHPSLLSTGISVKACVDTAFFDAMIQDSFGTVILSPNIAGSSRVDVLYKESVNKSYRMAFSKGKPSD